MNRNERPPLTFSLLFQFFLLALLGITANQGFYLLGLYYASPTFASAMQNSVPAITFVMASALGLEEVNIARIDGLAKILGTIANVGGATVNCDHSIQRPSSSPPADTSDARRKLHTSVINQSSELDMGLRILAWTLFVLGCLDGFSGNCIVWGVISLQTWCIQRGGPVCVAVFQPLQTFLVAIMAALILGDQLCSGGYIEQFINPEYKIFFNQLKNGIIP
ncbi:WAT1-related protein At3g18200-like [Arachis ipaensis]|uniref:WAT1-related protein At3g18200-like n=1 Tax=Arachis ipaensis TaxID=130454 RepID=UPI000A2B1F18|nr:WAT1-related protein At3g18200-like [Arachis ipaensis]